jgi:ribonuclease J
MDTYKLRLVPLGGVAGVTKNMFLYEIYENENLKDILIVDCGIGFPMERELGVDFVIPDITYLRDKKDKIRAILLSHGHYDHIAALPYHYKDLGTPPIWGSRLSLAFVKNQFKEFGIEPKLNLVDEQKEYQFADFKVEFVHVTHSIQDTLHMVIKTPVGNFYHGTDFKLDLTPPYERPPDFYKMTKAGAEGVLCLLSDCLGAEREGLTLSENIVGQTFEDEMRKTKGKFIMTTFSTNISRIRQCAEAAVKFNRKIVFLGRSMRENTKAAAEIAYLKIPYDFIIKEEAVMRMPPNKVCMIVAGSQGQYNSALSKLATGQNRSIKIKPGDRVMLSSDPIPGNENEIYTLIEELSMQGAEVLYSDIQEQLHASGHGNTEDLKFLIRFTNPKFFVPIGGTIRHQNQYKKLVTEMGYKKESVFALDEGETLWFTKGNATAGNKVETKNVYVDAYGVGDVGRRILRDRSTLATEGIVVAILAVDNQGRLAMRPNIISRGFVFEPKEEKLFEEAQILIEGLMKPKGVKLIDVNNIKQQAAAELEEFFFRARGRKPLVIVDVMRL